MAVTQWVQIGRMDELARLDTPVHRLDARAKAVVTIAFIVAVMSFPPRSISALTPFVLFPVGVLAVGRIPPRDIVRKILIAAPFAVLIGMLNPFLDREPVTTLGPWVVTGGWLSFGSILIRFLLTVSAALALIAVTGMVRLGAGLEQLGVPRVFVVQLLFLYRYLFVVVEQGVKVLRAVELRSGGRNALRLKGYGSLVGHLLLRSMDRAERIHRAMVSRGFDGEIRLLLQTSFGRPEWVFLVGCLTGFAVARWWNLADVLGAALTGGRA